MKPTARCRGIPRHAGIVIAIVLAVSVLTFFLYQPLTEVPSQKDNETIENEVSPEKKIGLGISHYDLSNITIHDESRLVAARVMNTGTESLTISVVWQGTGLDVICDPQEFTMRRDESVKIYIVVTPKANGVYDGIVEIKGSAETEGGGNQVVSGGTIEVHISVVD